MESQVQHLSTLYEGVHLIEAHYHRHAFKRHYHFDYHVGIITQGAQRFFHRGAQHLAGPGDIIIMPPDDIHDGQPEQQDYQVKVFSINPRWLSELADKDTVAAGIRFTQHHVHDSAVRGQLTQLHYLLQQQNGFRLAMDCLPLDCFSELVQRYSKVSLNESHALGYRMMMTVRDYLHVHLADKVTLEELAALCSLTPLKFLRQFKKATGMTPYAYFSCLRLETALQQLRRGKRSTDVAHDVGFYDQAHFVRAFKNMYSVAPSKVSPRSKLQ